MRETRLSFAARILFRMLLIESGKSTLCGGVEVDVHTVQTGPPTEERRLDDRDGHKQASDFEDWFRETA